MTQQKLSAGSVFPSLKLNTLQHGEMDLSKTQNGKERQMLVVYRGKHCPLCTKYLTKIEQMKDTFSDLGMSISAVSADPESKAIAHNEEMNLSFPVAYGLTIDQMKELGLYISHPRSPQETDRPFSEPGLFIIKKNGQLQIIDISNLPSVRPDLDAMAAGLKFTFNPENNYPIRGTYSD